MYKTLQSEVAPGALMSREDFIDRAGAMEVLFEVATGKVRFTDVEKTVSVSTSTVSNRLQEGKQEGLWTEELEETDTGSSRRVYVITDAGRELFQIAQEYEIPDILVKLRNYEQKYEEQLSELQEDIAS